MKIALKDNTLIIIEADNVQFSVMKSWGKLKWNKSAQALTGVADIELLDKVASLGRLPPHIEAYRAQLHQVQDAVDRERVNPEPEPMYKYPVKVPLYQHQVRGANMALLTFGMLDPAETPSEGIGR